ncbi:MAG: response regulator transcription factor [Cyclobacteriaceae bacterium]|nr:response regulator transcription factor [Cyclobacteriaceae bacterium]
MTSSSKEIRIMLLDDHSVVRKGIRILIENVENVKIVCEASDGLEALKMIEQYAPDILISDISIPGISGLDLAAKLRDAKIKTKVLFLTMHQEEEYVIKAFENGATGYLHKGVEEDEIIEAVIKASKGEKHFNKNISEILTKALLNKGGKKEKDIHLTERETEILKHIVDGKSNKIISEQLFISIRTVDTHRTNIMRKLKVNNIAELVKYTYENKML